jgi:hypothetical protein
MMAAYGSRRTCMIPSELRSPVALLRRGSLFACISDEKGPRPLRAGLYMQQRDVQPIDPVGHPVGSVGCSSQCPRVDFAKLVEQSF